MNSSQPLGSLTLEDRIELERRLLKARGNKSRPTSIPRLEGNGPFALSFAQQRLWFLEELDPGSGVYHIPLSLHLEGVLDLRVFRQALQEIVRRHLSLRTTFRMAGADPVQVVGEPQPVPLRVVDLGELLPEQRAAEMRRVFQEETRRPFHLSSDLMIRAVVVRQAEREHGLLVVMHHIACDGWSVGIFARELSALYEAFATAKPSPLPELPLQYADFAVWQRNWLQGSTLQTQLAYWRERLAGAPPVLELPTDRPRPPVQTYRGGQEEILLPPDLVQRLGDLGRREGVTPFMTLLAAFQALLGRYSRQEDVVVGAPVAGRGRSELEPLIGFFVNTLVLRTDLAGQPSFRQLVGRVKEVALGAFAHQDVPFEKLVEDLQPERDASRSPLFQVLFVLQNVPREELQLPGLTMQRADLDHHTAKFDLQLTISEKSSGMRVSIVYNQDLFDPATIQRMLDHYRRLLDGAVAEPDRPLWTLPLLQPAEWEQLAAWNATQRIYPQDQCVHDLVQAQVRRTPQALAVVFGTEKLTYEELNGQANQWAHYLRGLGIGPDSLVGLCVERSLNMVVGALAILKAGGAYVPLDANYPQERLAAMLADAQPAVLLTEESLRDRLPAMAAPLVYLDADRHQAARCPTEDLIGESKPQNLAYVIYTSGSTGRPKGVEVTHGSVVNFLRSMAESPGLTPDDVVPALTTLTFDIAGLEIFLPLTVGARVVVVDRQTGADGVALSTLLERCGATVVQATPATWGLLLDTGWRGQAGLKVLCGGEALPRPLADRLLATGVELWNVYGPTETTIWSTLSRVLPGAGAVAIGRPIANTQVYLLDAYAQPVPVGVAGELCIGGAGLARGYRNRPALTADKFVPDQFGSECGARLYRTGDLARYRSDGTLECLGRLDHQVKVRGFRIELGEVEAVLSQHPAVRAVAVVVREDLPGDKRLVAYVALEGEQAVPGSDLRDFVKEKLPEYMVPGAVVCLDQMPLTPNGKIDRNRLPSPPASETGPVGSAPRTLEEEVLAEIFARVLGLKAVGIQDHFFERGGHSLLAARVIAQVRDVLSIELPLRAIFATPTVEGLAGQLAALRRAGQAPAGPAPVRVPRDVPLPLSFAQQRLWFIDRLEPGGHVYNVPLLARLSGTLNRAALEQALAQILTRHESLRTVFTSGDGEPVQQILPLAPDPVAVVDLSHLDESEREPEARRLATQEAQRPFDLDHGPLLRANLLRLGDQDHVLVIVIHHIACDGWSVGVLMRELSALYEGLVGGRPAVLPELAVQYADYAVWQRSWLQGPALQAQLAYWQQRLAGAPPVLELPTDRPRPPVQTYRGGQEEILLPPSLLQRLGELGRREGATPFMTLLAAFQALLARYSRQEDVVVGAPVAGRGRSELEPLIGFFVNTLVLRTDLSGQPTFRQLVGRVKEVALGALAHQDVPFEKLVEELQPERDASRSPLFQVFFVLQNAPREALQLPGLTLRRGGFDHHTAKFDLQLTVSERAEGQRVSMVYNRDLFDAETIRRMLEHYQILLEGAVAEPDRPVERLPLLRPAERQQLAAWSRTQQPYPRDLCVQDLVEAQVRRTPDAVAALFGDRRLTYRELNERANRLAHYLRGLGAGPDRLVGLCLERSLELVVGTLAVLKAGAAYVPLDPAYPAERLAVMLADARPAALLTQQRPRAKLPPGEAPVVCLDADWPQVAQTPGEDPPRRGGPENLAYVLYTSGTTGTPKGVAMPHRPLVNLLHWQLSSWAHGGPALTTQFASLNFDVSFQEIFATLASGGALRVLPDEVRQDPAALARLLADEPVGRAYLPPVVLQHLAEAVESTGRPPRALREVICAGEQLQVTRPGAQLFGRLKGCVLQNHYGPTEAHVVTWHTLQGDPAAWPAQVPIGRPIANAEIHLLDRHGQPVPVGVPGELYIGGVCLARGYLHRPDLTSEKFVAHPFSEDPGARLYRTGDAARWRADGTIECLGRLDSQVKLRGFRIELGEVEAVLSQHPAVRATAVIVREDQRGDKNLLAYVAVDADQAVKPVELRKHLKDKLPAYMVPAAVVCLDRLPLTRNGKVDRKALPNPTTDVDGGSEGPEPRNAEEEILAGIYGQLLGHAAVGRDDDFFELGGHSLLATRVVSQIRAIFQIELPLVALFEAPTVAGLAERIIATRQSGQGLSTPPLVPVPRGRRLPVSFAQQRLWFIDQMFPGNHLYNIPTAFRLAGSLNEAALESALTEIVRRHEVLRTTFAVADGQPIQVPHDGVRVPWQAFDLRAIPADQREAEEQRIFREMANRPFNLSRDIMLRAAVTRLEDHRWGLLLVQHHIAGDGWSRAPLVRELTALYEAFAAGRVSPLPDLTIQYADYSVWQRNWLQGDALQHQLSYWRQHLAGAATLELPLDHARPAVQSSRGGGQAIHFPPEFVASLKRLSRDEGATLFMTLLAAFQALLHRYTGQLDICVGTPIAGRNRAEVEPLIGFFLNTLVLRTDLSGRPSFRQLLQRVREVALGAYAHQDAPFDRLVEELVPIRDTSRTPLFQVLFVLQNIPNESLQWPGLAVTPMTVDYCTAKFDLQVTAVEKPGGLTVMLLYNRDLFEGSTAARMLEHFRVLLEGAVRSPNSPVATLPLLTSPEKDQLLIEWNKTRTGSPQGRSIAQLFEDQVERAPQAVALVHGDRQVTYQELNARANRLAHYLRRFGVDLEVPVAVCAERSPEMIVALLAILKAGGAYVPLDAGYPRERLAFLLGDTRTQILLTQRHLIPAIPTDGLKIIFLEDGLEQFAAENEANPVSGATADNLAYVVYTSGSSGLPKGVGVPHRGVVRLVKSADYATLSAQEVFLQFAPVTFDASTFEIWGSLLNGARLVIMPGGTPSLKELADVLHRYGVSTLWLTAGLFHQMVESNLDGLRPVRQLLAGGDVLAPACVQKVVDELGHCTLINGYGPTENATFTCCYPIRKPGPVGRAVPIGRPIANTRAYILDTHMQPVPIGVVGELYTSGDGLARGYLNRPELTAEKFLPDPFSPRPGERLYRTGDLARYRADGNIEFLGRRDGQVKVRGFRIELGEIEVVLSQHPAVQNAAVVVQESTVADKQLVAYLVVDPIESDTAADLRRFAKEKLPAYMIPNGFVFLKELPLTANGKVDRRALPAFKPEKLETGEAKARPRTGLERQLLRIWEQVLGLDSVGMADDFFELGGHSLLAVKLVAEIEKAIYVSVPLVAFFQAPTVEQMARYIDDQAGVRTLPTIIPVQTKGSRPPIFFAAEAGINALGYAKLARALGPDQPFYVVQAQRQPKETETEWTKFNGRLQRPTVQQVHVEVAAEYLQAMRSVQPHGPYLVGGMCRGAQFAYCMALELQQQGEEVALLVVLDTPSNDTLNNLWYVRRFVSRLRYYARKLRRLWHQPFRVWGQAASRAISFGLSRLWRFLGSKKPRITNQNAVGGDRLRIREVAPLEKPITLMRVRRQAYYWHTRSPTKGWERRTTKGVEVHLVPGEHQMMLREPHVLVLAKKLGDCIARAVPLKKTNGRSPEVG
jgi:amino acid adenylation domain-containing protein